MSSLNLKRKRLAPMIVNNNVIDFCSQPISFKLHSAIDYFIKQGTKLNLTGQVTLTTMADDVLNVMGVTTIHSTSDHEEVENFHKNYSFIESEYSQKPQLIDAKDKFAAVDDLFYSQDDELPETRKKLRFKSEINDKISTIKIASEYIAFVTGNRKQNNKYLNISKINKLRRSRK